MKTMTATRIPATHPARDPRLVRAARGDNSMRMAAMIGTGLIAIRTARGKISQE